MINTDRIVPVQAQDLITLYGIAMALANLSPVKIDAENPQGDFVMSAAQSGNLLASEPVRTFEAASAVTAFTLYFVPTYDYQGFTLNGTAVTPTGAVEADGRSLYKAVLASGAITITKIGF